MKATSVHINLRLDPGLVARIDAWRTTQPVPPPRTAAVTYMLEMFLRREDTPQENRER